LLEEFLKSMGLSQHRLALSIGVDPLRINEIVLGKRRVTADTALRLARFLAPRRNSGWVYRAIMIWTSRGMCWESGWKKKCVFTR